MSYQADLHRPANETATLLAVYDFALANKLFCHHFISLPSAGKGEAAPFSSFLSFTSYLGNHAYRSSRASSYAYLTLLILLNLVEDAILAKLLCETTTPVRLCRQRPPLLPLMKGDRPYITAILDIMMDNINHNLRKNLDISFYQQSFAVLSRVVAYLAKSHTKLPYHWSELWKTTLSFIRFLTTYADNLQRLPNLQGLVDGAVDLLSTSLSNGEAFLPDAAAYDDLFYKLVESGEALTKFRDAYNIAKVEERSSINTLIGVSKHYQELIETQKNKATVLTPREVSRIIKQGYETLSIETKDGLEQQSERYREADHKVALKKIARVAVGDAANLVS